VRLNVIPDHFEELVGTVGATNGELLQELH
jgi:hypothetical protein